MCGHLLCIESIRLNQPTGMKLWINQDPFFIPSILLALTKFTLTAVLIAQFTSPHRQTLAGEGKIPPLAHLPK